MNDPLVDGELHLREVEREDLTMLKHWRNEWSVRSTTREYRLLTQLDQERWYESLIRKPPEHCMFVIEAAHKPLGCAGLTWIDWKNRNSEISIYIGSQENRGRGLGKRVIRMLEDYGFGELNLFRLYAEVYDFNHESLSLFQSAGFTATPRGSYEVWRNGEWHGAMHFEKIEPEWSRPKRSK